MNQLVAEQLTIQINHSNLFENFSIQFNPGEMWGILGPNGIGKTTLLHTLAGLKKPFRGKVQLQQHNIYELNAKERAKKIGLLLQNTEFSFPSTVLETAMIGRFPHSQHWFNENSIDTNIAKNALKLVGIDHLTHRSTLSLSGGEQRRLELAVILAQNPDIYLLDEPTNHLDMQQKMKTLSLFSNLAKEQHKTVIMISHDFHLIKTFCDNIIMIGYNGEIEIGSAKVMLNKTTLGKFYSQELIQICENYWL